MEVQDLPLGDLVLDPALNLRDKLDEDAVERYAEAWDLLPPLIVFDVEGRLLLADGFHRHAAAQRLDKRVVTAEVRTGSYHDALDHASEANLGHGLPLNRSERRRAIEVKLRLRPDWSDRRLSETLGVGRESVAKVRKQLVDAGQIPSAGTRVGSDGKARPVGLPRDPNERLPQGPDVATAGEAGPPVERERKAGPRSKKGFDDTKDPMPVVKDQAALSPAPGPGPLAPWEGPDEFVGKGPVAVPELALAPSSGTQTVVVANGTEMVALVASQVCEIASWTVDSTFADAYRGASPESRRQFQEAIATIAASAQALANLPE